MLAAAHLPKITQDPVFSPAFYAPYAQAVHIALEHLCAARAAMEDDVLALRWRLKTPDSIRDKLRKKRLPETAQAAGAALRDVAGLRVVLRSQEAVYRYARSLLELPGLQLETVHDYIQSPKPSGYRSLHLIVCLRLQLHDQRLLIPAEIQLRTAAMDAWACAEHRLIYKPQA